jgi:hypothetical protein
MNLTANDLYGMDNKSKEYYSTDEDDEMEEKPCVHNISSIEGYNPNFTLRKCCSKLLDKLANLFPDQLFEAIKLLLEENLQQSEWNIK